MKTISRNVFLGKEVIGSKQSNQVLFVRGCQSVYVLRQSRWYLPNYKNICYGESCIQGKCWQCTHEEGLYFRSVHLSNSGDECNSDDDGSNDDFYCCRKDRREDEQEYEWKSINVNALVLVVELLSPSNAFEIFYLCKV